MKFVPIVQIVNKPIKMLVILRIDFLILHYFRTMQPVEFCEKRLLQFMAESGIMSRYAYKGGVYPGATAA